ncbi:FecR family protein [Chitinophaga barathri]|uniref:FecR family protein n=1 Tax=Chitinophaga barathri TaxID=1647451 RepID=A0A3N4MJC3_9BACT|nr:FecR family protein [Chitinophaga barathri]RPD42156.1 FecR family protein [Chitinophaga barathri]
MMNKALLEELTDRYITGAATAAEKQQLQSLLDDPLYLEAFEQMVLSSLEAEKYQQEPDEQVFRRIYAGIEKQLRPAPRVRSLKTYLAAAAAVLLLILAGGAYVLLNKNTTHQPPLSTPLADVQPGGNKAVLTLADGTTVTVDSAARQIAQGGGTIQQQNGQLQYTTSASIPDTYNTLTTPPGGQYRLRLPDGTEVWLNAASSIRFPVTFAKTERKVEVTGEAYFEVAQNAASPFKVIVNKQTEVQVLGTSFNINAYTDEQDIKTTLLSGKVKVIAGNTGVQLSPGQQAVNRAGRVEVNKNVDTDKVTAWKNGLFNFQDASLEEVMRQLSRWYNIEIIYENGIPDMEFYGKMQRDIPLSAMLKMLERAEVKFRLEGNNRLVVLTVQ